MDGVFSCTDSTGSYCANIISKNGRNEVQIYPIDHSSSQNILIDTLIKKHELTVDDDIIAAAWTRDLSLAQNRGTKRSQTEDEVSESSSSSSDNVKLVVLIENGQLVVFSPNHNESINRISYKGKLNSLTSSLNRDTVFSVDDDGNLLEVSLIDNKQTTHKFKLDTNVSIAKTVQFKGNGSTSKSQHLLLGSQELYLIDTARTKKVLVHDFPKFGKEQFSSPITFIEQSKAYSDLVFVARKDFEDVFVYNLSKPESYGTLRTTSSNIINLTIVTQPRSKQESLFVFTENGVEVFKVDSEYHIRGQQPSTVIKTNFHTATDPILFSNVFIKEDGALVGIWHDKFQPQFTVIDWSNDVTGELIVPVDYVENNDVEVNDASELDIIISDGVKINNLPFAELSKKLTTLLINKRVDETEVLRLCMSNNDETNIKETIQSFSTLSASPTLTNNLFPIVSKKVASEPSKQSSLSIWLKWLLIAHGGFISKQSSQVENLKTLQGGLDDGMKLVPKLLALQGRLQLLKAQAEFRNKVNTDQDLQDRDDDVDQTINDSFANQTTLAEESIVYANGENDDFEGNDITVEAPEVDDDDDDEIEVEAN